LSSRELPKEDRRDGVPFALVLFALMGVIVEWFNYNQAWARALDHYTVGGFFGRLAFALPVIVLVFAAWLFRNPSSVYPNGRVGVGLGLLLTSVSGMTHLASGRPAPGEATFEQLASGGGLLGWVVAEPFVFLANSTEFLAWPVMVVFFLISVLIMTKTPPNRIVARVREAYAYLFGVELEFPSRAATQNTSPGEEFGTLSDLGLDIDNADSMPWWRRGKKEKKDAFDSPIVSEVDPETGEVATQEDLLEQLRKAEEALAQATAVVPEPAPTPAEASAAAPEAHRVPIPSNRPYQLPSGSVLVPGHPLKHAAKRTTRWWPPLPVYLSNSKSTPKLSTSPGAPR